MTIHRHALKCSILWYVQYNSKLSDYVHVQNQGILARVCLQRFSSIFKSTIITQGIYSNKNTIFTLFQIFGHLSFVKKQISGLINPDICFFTKTSDRKFKIF